MSTDTDSKLENIFEYIKKHEIEEAFLIRALLQRAPEAPRGGASGLSDAALKKLLKCISRFNDYY